MRTRRRSRTPSPKRVLVRNITRNVNQEHLKEIFGTFGDVTQVVVPMHAKINGTNTGKAEIFFKASSGAEKARRHMDGAQIDGNVVEVIMMVPDRGVRRPVSQCRSFSSSSRSSSCWFIIPVGGDSPSIRRFAAAIRSTGPTSVAVATTIRYSWPSGPAALALPSSFALPDSPLIPSKSLSSSDSNYMTFSFAINHQLIAIAFAQTPRFLIKQKLLHLASEFHAQLLKFILCWRMTIDSDLETPSSDLIFVTIEKYPHVRRLVVSQWGHPAELRLELNRARISTGPGAPLAATEILFDCHIAADRTRSTTTTAGVALLTCPITHDMKRDHDLDLPSAAELNCREALLCRSCARPIADLSHVRKALPLPSDHWMDMSELWV